MTMGYISTFIRANLVSDITPSGIEYAVNTQLGQMEYGLRDVAVKITTFAVVKTFRLIQDGSGLYENLSMDTKK